MTDEFNTIKGLIDLNKTVEALAADVAEVNKKLTEFLRDNEPTTDPPRYYAGEIYKLYDEILMLVCSDEKMFFIDLYTGITWGEEVEYTLDNPYAYTEDERVFNGSRDLMVYLGGLGDMVTLKISENH